MEKLKENCLQGGTVVNHEHRLVADVLVEGKVITQVSPALEVRPKLPND